VVGVGVAVAVAVGVAVAVAVNHDLRELSSGQAAHRPASRHT
jgi:hypothetical protein